MSQIPKGMSIAVTIAAGDSEIAVRLEAWLSFVQVDQTIAILRAAIDLLAAEVDALEADADADAGGEVLHLAHKGPLDS